MTDTKQTMWIRSVPTDLARKIRAGAALHGLTLAQWMAEAYAAWQSAGMDLPINQTLTVKIAHDIVEEEQK